MRIAGARCALERLTRSGRWPLASLAELVVADRQHAGGKLGLRRGAGGVGTDPGVVRGDEALAALLPQQLAALGLHILGHDAREQLGVALPVAPAQWLDELVHRLDDAALLVDLEAVHLLAHDAARIVGGHLLRIEQVMSEPRRVHLYDDERDEIMRRPRAAAGVARGLLGVVLTARPQCGPAGQRSLT